ncbi:MAG: hypothetical protein QN149_10620, partial [Armatimonadota bacterium]|nr:hypothetical protein [Armatimonadota bacterium]
MIMRHFLSMMTAVCVLALAAPIFGAPTSVPRQYVGIYDELQGQLARFEAALRARWDGTRAPVLFSGELLAANGHVGEALIRPGREQRVETSLDAFQTLGLQAATVQISFPMLYRPFYRSAEEHAAYLAAYRQVAAAVRRRGMKLIVKSQAIFSKGGWTTWDVGSFYRRLSLDEYIRGRTDVALTIARELRPDYLSVVMEPDTEADQTGLPMDTAANSVRLVTSVLSALRRAGLTEIRVGAGVGTWHRQYDALAQAFAATGVDFIDIHVYPVNRDYLDRAVTVAWIAKRAGKAVAMTEAWLYKAGSAELSRGVTSEEIFGRDAFSFWEPLDQKFLEVMVTFAHAERLAFFSPYWTKYFSAYLDFEQAKGLAPRDLAALSTRAAGEALAAGRFTQTGLTYKTLIASGAPPPPTAPSSTPGSARPSRVLVENGGRVAWSHVRDLIAYDHIGPDGSYEISTIRPDGTESRCLTCGQRALPRSHRGNPAWHPSGDYLVLQAHNPAVSSHRGPQERYLGTPGIGIHNDIWIISADGARAWKVTNVGTGGGVLHPRFSHDGRTLVWSEVVDPGRRGLGGQWAIKIAEVTFVDGAPRVTNVRTVQPGGLQLYETHSFSPDDGRLLFSGVPRGGTYFDLEIYSYELRSGRLLRLTQNREWDEHAHFTPDGRAIVWASSEGIAMRKDPRDLRLDYWTMAPDGRGKRRLTWYNESPA